MLSSHDTEVDELIVVEDILHRFLEFVQAQLEKRECKHFFIDSVNLWEIQEDHPTAQEFDFCRQAIETYLDNYKSSKTLVKNVFCTNSRVEMMIQDLKKRPTRQIKVLIATLALLNIVCSLLGAVFYIAGFVFVITIIICFVYASIILVPVMLSFVFLYFVAQCVKRQR